MSAFTSRMRKLWWKILLFSAITTLFFMVKVNDITFRKPKEVVSNPRHQVALQTDNKSGKRKLLDFQNGLLKLPRANDSVFNFNVTHSDLTPIERNVTDTRPDVCSHMTYTFNRSRKASVVIPFYNEALSMLLRTVHSILNKSPSDLLADIILVDDHSSYDNLQEPLREYVAFLSPKILVIRNKKREGLIRNRMIGAEYTTGDVVIFVDAHTEVNKRWLEPILAYLGEHPSAIIQPTVDWLTSDTIDYRDTGVPVRGAFAWDMTYMWIDIPKYEFDRRSSPSDPIRTPTLMGCAIAANKDYFYNLGGFDRGLNVWGGENIEISFRAWLCGGEIVILPCSRIGHLYKPFSYSFDGNKELIVAKNNMRVVETWMDDYKKYYYAAVKPFSWKWATLSRQETLSLEEHKQLRGRLKCKKFKWYMENVLPELNIPPSDTLYFGRITNVASRLCWDVAKDGFVVMRYNCFEHRLHPEDDFTLTLAGELKYNERCVTLSQYQTLVVGDCNESPDLHWSLREYDSNVGSLLATIKKAGNPTVYCVEQVTNVAGNHVGEQMPQLANCNHENKFQSWFVMYHFDFS